MGECCCMIKLKTLNKILSILTVLMVAWVFVSYVDVLMNQLDNLHGQNNSIAHWNIIKMSLDYFANNFNK